jgi:purine nucleoside phosphorylase
MKGLVMRIAVSACLLGENCKYNGGNNYSEKLVDYIKGNDVLSVCPEVMGGLPVPRESAEIVNGVVSHKDGTSVDKEFRKGAKKALEIVKEENVDLVILQSRSPSCGVNSIYDGSFSGKLISGKGVFADLLQKNGIKVMDIADL